MIRSYLVVAFRRLTRNKAVSIINISGLSIGLACCMLIFLYTKDELSYDRFHSKRGQIYRITANVVDDHGNEMFRTGKTGLVHGAAFKKEIPEIRDFVRVIQDQYILRKDGHVFNETMLFADDNFFDVFSFPLISGDPRRALAPLHSMVITDETAEKYFGSVDVVGKTLELQLNGTFEPFVITAVAKRCPQNSTIKFDLLLPMKFEEQVNPDDHWMTFNLSTFVLLTPKANVATILPKMTQVFLDKAKDQLKEQREKYDFRGHVQWGLQPLLQIHLSKDYDAEDELSDASKPVYSYILTGIAVLIMLIACINFINLTIAHSLKRNKEIGIRKVIGGQRSQLIRQFLGESFVVCFIAFAFAILLAAAALPVFNELANKRLSMSYLFDAQLVAGFAGLFLITGLAAGFYPALVLSGFNPIQTLYDRVKLAGRNYLAKGLIVVQFALAGVLIIGTSFIYQQSRFLTHEDLGYNDKDLVVVNVGGEAGQQFPDLFKTELLRNPAIRMVAMHSRGRTGFSGKAGDKQVMFDFEQIDDQYFPALQIPIITGRNFSPDFPADSSQSAVINETFAREAGWKDPIGKTVELIGQTQKFTVVGVVRDYHFRPLNEKIGPQLFTPRPHGGPQFNIKIASTDVPQTLQFIGNTFRRLAPYYPFDYTFRDEANLRAYEAVDKWKQIIGYSAGFTILISCIGLLGLIALSAERRTKEIGIRKVLGASVSNIVRMLSGNFLRLVAIANLIALPVAWWAVNKWLQNFAYHIGIHWWVFVLAVLVTLSIALLTVGIQAMRAALANPVKNLRTE